MKQDPHQPFSCFLIGSDTLLIECGKLLIQRGHTLEGVLTDAPRVDAWASSQGVKVDSFKQDLLPLLSAQPYDYLFSITHLQMIPESALKTPRQSAINFHDGPLPRYAGLNAPAWALMNRETEYGITWHEMTAHADEGDILEQVLFDVAPDETSLSLNTRCFAAALESFDTLIDRLASGQTQRQIQELSHRSYFGRDQKPTLLGTLDFHNQSADDLEARIRALDFGPYLNPLAAAKWVLPGGVFHVTAATSQPSPNPDELQSPGQISEISASGITIQAAEGLLQLRGLQSSTGDPVSPQDIASSLGLRPGDILSPIDSEQSEELDSRSKQIARAERFWLQRLERFSSLDCPYVSASLGPQETWTGVDIALPAAWTPSDHQGEALLSGILVWLSRLSRRDQIIVPIRGLCPAPLALESAFSDYALIEVAIDSEEGLGHFQNLVAREIHELRKRAPWLNDTIVRHPSLATRPEFRQGTWAEVEIVLADRIDPDQPLHPHVAVSLQIERSGGAAHLQTRDARVEPAHTSIMGAQIHNLLESLSTGSPIGRASLLGTALRQKMLYEWNQTEQTIAGPATIDAAFEAQAQITPERPAVHFEGSALSYMELDQRANGLAHRLARSGVRPGDLVGIYVERSLDLPVAVLAVLKAGAAYVPLDPSYPRDRIAFMIENSGLRALLTRRDQIHTLPATYGVEVIRIDQDRTPAKEPPQHSLDPADLCYVIYTSGSTGQPKGVMVEHRNVINFFQGMDDTIDRPDSEKPGVWFAVTSLSFDISVLEILWTLARGFEVVLYMDRKRGQADNTHHSPASAHHIDFGLFYWGNDDGPGRQKYRLLLEGARFADQNGFIALWTPERHFHAFGGPYPNPAITGAAVAAITQNLEIRSGSCVLPLHDPIRVAEEWAVLDNLSNGRVALGVASGWQPNDFILAPKNFKDNKTVTSEYIEKVRKLWRGEEIPCPGPLGEDVLITTQPRPVQPELPIWMTTAGNPESYRTAARMKSSILTHLLGQSIEEVGKKIALYREALSQEGLDPQDFKVTLMLHTYVGEDTEAVRELVREPMKEYLGSSVSLVKNFAWAFPAFKRPEGLEASADDIDLNLLSNDELDAILDHAFERYFETSGLFGDIERCVEIVERCKAIGVDEIACLIDYGVDTDDVIEALPRLKQVLDHSQAISITATREQALAQEYGLAEQFQKHGVTHFQSTPSMAKMLLEDNSTREALRSLEQMLVGGEALSTTLVDELNKELQGSLVNMYGPTETTIWSSTHRIDRSAANVPIGRPIANTRLYVLDPREEPVPPGVPGELYIGGHGVARGYLGQPELTSQRFLPDPFSPEPDARMYRTGDLVSLGLDGVVHFMGRTDHQVKIRGHRIELGEIEAQLNQRP
ncbi:MAG: LLM class flavin-dependent oxidoreductase, partial [Myxococcota bacterium]|nr:LLM class flavin-dependent oxidoreductase [Myxococcota bacterium]